MKAFCSTTCRRLLAAAIGAAVGWGAVGCGAPVAGPAGDDPAAANVDSGAALADAATDITKSDSSADGSDGAAVADTADGHLPGDTDADEGPADADAASAELPQNCPGAAFCPCQVDGECDNGKCLETPDGHACAPTCVEAACPAGFVCKQLGGSDPLSYCVYSHLSLCAPCSNNKDCQFQGVSDALCLDYGAVGHFCGGACGLDSDCGAGYACVTVADPAGGKDVQQCKANAGICGCSIWAKTAGTEAPCSISNSSGSCSGTRTCEAGGLTGCSAHVPTAEACNGQDDDCDGTIDVLPATATCSKPAFSGDGSGAACALPGDCTVGGESCEPTSGTCHTLIGQCPGKLACVGGKASCEGAKTPKLEGCNGEDDDCDGQTDEGFGWQDAAGQTLPLGAGCGVGACSGGSVQCLSFSAAGCSTAGKAGVESCNGSDDDCDGTTDEALCDDGNPCSVDACEASAGGCQHTPAAVPCDDGDACTLADACSGTTCSGIELACDDGNPCTADSCEPGTGTCAVASVGGSCSDGDACTVGDACGAGATGTWGCLPGASIACDDNNACTNDSCDSASGCVFLANGATAACYDGESGTENKGMCHGGWRTCAGGILGSACEGQVVPTATEACDGVDDTCDGKVDEGCMAASATLAFAAGQVAAASGALQVNVVLAPDRPAAQLQGQAPTRVDLGLLAWFVRLVTGK